MKSRNKNGGIKIIRRIFPAKTTPKEILKDVCREFRVKRKEILARNRSTLIFRARREAARRMRVRCRMSYPEIGRELKRDHASVISMLRRY